MAYVTYDATALGSGVHVVRGVYATQAEANTAASGDSDLTAYTGVIDNDVQPGNYLDPSTGMFVTFQAESAADNRRAQVKRWLSQDFDAANLIGWSAADSDKVTSGEYSGLSKRAANTIQWAKAIDRAAQVDGNLTDQSKWGVIEAEMKLGTRTWYVAHDEARWTAVRGAMLTVFYKTGSSAEAVADSNISMGLPADRTNHKFSDFLK